MFVKAPPSALAFLATIITGFASGAAARSASPEIKIAQTIVCQSDAMTGPAPSLHDIEQACLPLFNGAVVRSNEVLRVLLRNGATKLFENAPISCDEPGSPNDCVSYTLQGYYPQNEAIVVERWLDGPASFLTGAHMVERGTGRVIDLPGQPHYSPDGSRFVSMAVCYDHCANRIEMWSIRDGVAKLQWRHRVKQGEKTYFYAFREWQGNEQIKFRIFPEVEIEGDSGREVLETEAVDAKLTRTGQGWRIERAPKR